MIDTRKFSEILLRIKMRAAFYDAWIDEKKKYLESLEYYFSGLKGDKETPRWRPLDVPKLVDSVSPSTKRKPVFESWDDYFKKQRKAIKGLRTGHVIPFCHELPWFIRESIEDKRSRNVLNCWRLLILEALQFAHVARYPFEMLREIDYQVSAFDRSLHHFWGWHHDVAPMLPDYLLGKNRRENLKTWGKHKKPREKSEDVDARNERIRKAAEEIRNRSKKRNKSTLEVARILSIPPYQFQTINKEPLSLRQIRKIIS